MDFIKQNKVLDSKAGDYARCGCRPDIFADGAAAHMAARKGSSAALRCVSLTVRTGTYYPSSILGGVTSNLRVTKPFCTHHIKAVDNMDNARESMRAHLQLSPSALRCHSSHVYPSW